MLYSHAVGLLQKEGDMLVVTGLFIFVLLECGLYAIWVFMPWDD